MLFLSHSASDLLLVEALVDFFRSALAISPDNLRCTSLDGYRLPGGVSIDDQLRREVYDASAFIGLISPSCFRSLYVVFELGARWGAGKKLIPLLAPGMFSDDLPPPLSALNPLSCAKPADLHQLAKELSKALTVDLYDAATYQCKIDHILHLPPVQQEPLIPGSRSVPLGAWPHGV